MENIEALYSLFKQTTGISTDTRNIAEGNLFFALKGPNFNANDFALQALEAGAAAAVVDDPAVIPDQDPRFFLVKDGLLALQQLANYHRRQLDIPFLAITGSNGKTTTKELINAVLSTSYTTYATKGNLNNHIGVPLTLLAMDEHTQIGIVEMGANKLGDIAELCEIAEPSHGLITNIGRAHLEGFGGFEGVLRTKTELYQFLIKHQGKIFVNSQNPVLANMMKRMDHPISYPAKGDFFHCEFVEANPLVRFRTDDGQEYSTQMLGEYNFENIATALAVAKFFEVDQKTAAQAVSAYVPGNMRSQLVEKGSNLIVLDAYNANPSSMEQAIRTFGEMSGKAHKMVILGDMYELGDSAAEEHKKLGEWVSEYDIDKVCFTGELVQNALLKAPRALYFPDPFSLRNWLADSNLQNHLILIKGSRGMKLEGLVEYI